MLIIYIYKKLKKKKKKKKKKNNDGGGAFKMVCHSIGGYFTQLKSIILYFIYLFFNTNSNNIGAQLI
jgi:hypothetical protein